MPLFVLSLWVVISDSVKRSIICLPVAALSVSTIMLLHSKIALFGASISYVLLSALVNAAPHEDYQTHPRMDISNSAFGKREDQDDTDADIAADGTGPLRDGK